MKDDLYGSRPYRRGWSPEKLLEFKQRPKRKKKAKQRVEALFKQKEPRK